MDKKRLTNWWIHWEDLKWPSPDVLDNIKYKADKYVEANISTAVIYGCNGRDNLLPLPHLYHRHADSDSVLRNPDPGLRHHPLRGALSRRTDRNVDRYSRRIHRQDLHGVKGQTDLHYKVL